MKTLFTISGTVIGGRDGQGKTSDGNVDIQFAHAKELGGAGNMGATPEHLFALGYAACFGSSLQYVAGLKKKKLAPDVSVTAVVSLLPRNDGGFALGVELEVKIPGVEAEEAKALAAQAHHVCPYSHAIQGNVPVKISVV